MNSMSMRQFVVRAGRLVEVVLILQRRGRVTARDLAVELEVSERTILRDLDELSGAGVPVYATRGPGGGFELLDDFNQVLPDPASWRTKERRPGPPERAAVRISPEGRQLAAVLGRLPPMRVRRSVPADSNGWLEVTFRLESFDSVVVELLALAGHVEVLEPLRLRREVSTRVRHAASLYVDDEPDHVDS